MPNKYRFLTIIVFGNDIAWGAVVEGRADAAEEKPVEEPPSLLDIAAKLRSGSCVPALREAVKAWKAADCKGITDTTRTLLNYWFKTDHKLKIGRPFKYHNSQQEAIETLIYVWEVEKIRTRKDLLQK